MHYTMNYSEISDRHERDAAAIADLQDYLGAAWNKLLPELELVEADGTSAAFQRINVILGFCGASGYPIHALGRKYTPTAYRAWMADGGPAIDEEGFTIKETIN